jgi:fructuronate reductase
MDGSQKLPQRILHTVRDCLRTGAPIDTLALVVAGWMRYVSGLDEHGKVIDVRDPLAAELARIAAAAQGDPAALCRGLFGVKAVFGDDLAAMAPFVACVQRHLASLSRCGVRATLAAAPH